MNFSKGIRREVCHVDEPLYVCIYVGMYVSYCTIQVRKMGDV